MPKETDEEYRELFRQAVAQEIDGHYKDARRLYRKAQNLLDIHDLKRMEIDAIIADCKPGRRIITSGKIE